MKNTYLPAKDFSEHHPLITGTLLLTAAGFLSRIIGFFYRIYLSRLFGEEGMGIFQLIQPVSGLTFALTAAAFQTTISKFVSARTDASPHQRCYPMMLGASISLPLSFLTAFTLYFAAEPIAAYYLSEPRTESLIRLLAFTIPFSAAHACINGYFYGIRKASVPAGTQFIEQIFRVGSVFLIATILSYSGLKPGLSLITIGLITGEAAGFAAAVFMLFRDRKSRKAFEPTPHTSPVTYRALFSMVLPLTANRVFLNALHSIEAASLPALLRTYGYDSSTALSVYGVLTGMAFPLVFFPNALTSSVSVLLLPTISENMAKGRKNEVRKTIIQTIQYCSVLGFFCMAFFLFLGKAMGTYLFHSELAGYFISELSFLCPFLYLNSTLSGILQGLGKATSLFYCNVCSLLLRLFILYGAVPGWGMEGYLWGILASQITLTLLSLYAIIKSRK